MIRSRLPLVAIALTLGLANLATAQDEATRAEARQQFSLGVSRYEGGDYQGALAAFQEAYRLAPHPMVRVNMANCYEHLDRPLEALHHFERFLAEADSASPEQRHEVEVAVRRLRQRVGEARIAVTPDGATVTIDSAETRRTPILEPVRLTAGTHQIDVRLEGYRSEHREVHVAGGETATVAIRLERGQDTAPVATAEPAIEPAAEPAAVEPEPTTAAVTEAPEPEPVTSGSAFEPRVTTELVVSGSAAAVFTVAAIITGSIALVANGNFNDAVVRSNDPSLPQADRAQAHADGVSAADLANTTSIITDLFIIGAVASAGLATFFFILQGLDHPADAQSAHLRVAPSVGRNGGGLVVAGSF